MSFKKQPPDDARLILSGRLRTLMDASGLSQHELAAKSGISQGQISNILRGKTGCSIDTADAIARALGIPLIALLMPDKSAA